jgi:anti-anti-sigma factor
MSEGKEEESLDRRLAGFAASSSETRLSRAWSSSPRSLVLVVEGTLDTFNSELFRKTVIASLGDAKARGGLILDLAGVSYASSTGIGALTAILVEAERHQIPLRLCHVPTNIQKILDVLGFTSFFSCIAGYMEER